MLIKRKLHFHIERTDSDSVFNFSLPTGVLNFMLYSGILLLIALITGSIIHVNNINKLALHKQLTEEYNQQIAMLQQLSGKAEDAKRELEILITWEEKVRNDNNLKSIDPAIRKVGTGGLPVLTKDIFEQDPDKNAYFNDIQKDIEQLKRISAFNRNTHEEAVDDIRLKDDIFRHTPTIYPTFGRITTRFGYRTHPITKKRDFHRGLDIANDKGTPIYAAADGVIKSAARKRLIGKMIEVDHGYGYKTVYGHLDEYLVKPGDKVKKGQIIGLMGNTGRSTGPHLHYEIIYYGKARNPVPYLNRSKDKIKLKNS